MAPRPPHDTAGTAPVPGKDDYFRDMQVAVAAANVEVGAEAGPTRTEVDEQLAVPLDWQLMEEGSDEEAGDEDGQEEGEQDGQEEGDEDGQEEGEEEEQGDDDEDGQEEGDQEDGEGDDNEDGQEEGDQEEPGEGMKTAADGQDLCSKGNPKQDDIVRNLANAEYLFSRRLSYPGRQQVIVKGIDSMLVSWNVLDLMLKLGDDEWKILNIEKLMETAQLDKGLQQLHRALRILWTNMKKQEIFEGANPLSNLLAEIEGCCSLQPESTRSAVKVITDSVASLLVSCTCASPPYDEVMISAENIWGSIHGAREESITYPDP